MMMNVRMMMMIEAAVSRSGWLPWLLQTPVRLPGSSQMPRAMMRRGGGQGYLFVIFPPLWRQLKIRS